MGFKLFKNIVLLFIVNFQLINCISYYENENYQPVDHINSKLGHGVILHFPKYSIKVFTEKKDKDYHTYPNQYSTGEYNRYESYPSDTIHHVQSNEQYPPIYQPNPQYPPIYQPNPQYPPIYQPNPQYPPIYQSTDYNPNKYQSNQGYSPIYQPTQHNPTIEYHPLKNEFPLIHREPIETNPPCIINPVKEINPEVPYDPILGLPKSSNSQMWNYGALNWQTNNQNILRSETPVFFQEDQFTEPSSNIAEIENNPITGTANPGFNTDPRFIHSSSKFIKIHKPFGSKVIISKQKIIGHHDGFGHGHGSAGHFGGHGGQSFDHSFHSFEHPNHFGGGVTNVNKNTNIHVHSRNAENEEETIINDDNKRVAKDSTYERIVGSHLFAAPRWRRDDLIRTKRGVIDAVKVVTDHRARIDVPKTAVNVGAATRNLFEEDYSPVYHLRNALASAHDAVYTMLNVRPNGLLIPCRYKIVDGNEASPIVGAINPELFRQHGQSLSDGSTNYSPGQTIFSDGDPMQRMGEILRESVKWAHKSAEHATDAMHSARKAVVTGRKYWPKLFVPYVRAVEIIRPKIGQEEDIVGSAKDPEFVGVGKFMDYLGMTDKKPDFSPSVGLSHFGLPHQKTEEEILLQKAKESLGSPTYQQFMSQLRKELDSPAKKEIVGVPRLTPENIKAKLALDRLRNSIKLQKARADLKLKSKLPPKPIIPRLPIIPIKPLLLSKHPILRMKPPTIPKSPILKSERVGAANPIHKNEPPHPIEISDPIEELKYKINEHLQMGSNARTNQEENSKNIEKHLQEMKNTLYEKYNIDTNNLKHSDILALAIEEAQKNNPNILIEDVGAELNQENKEHVAAIPDPVYTKEMQTPFMGLATKEEIDKYFQQIYDSNNDKKVDNE